MRQVCQLETKNYGLNYRTQVNFVGPRREGKSRKVGTKSRVKQKEIKKSKGVRIGEGKVEIEIEVKVKVEEDER